MGVTTFFKIVIWQEKGGGLRSQLQEMDCCPLINVFLCASGSLYMLCLPTTKGKDEEDKEPTLEDLQFMATPLSLSAVVGVEVWSGE